MTCDKSIKLIASAIEGRVAPIDLETLMAHLTRCPGVLDRSGSPDHGEAVARGAPGGSAARRTCAPARRAPGCRSAARRSAGNRLASVDRPSPTRGGRPGARRRYGPPRSSGFLHRSMARFAGRCRLLGACSSTCSSNTCRSRYQRPGAPLGVAHRGSAHEGFTARAELTGKHSQQRWKKDEEVR